MNDYKLNELKASSLTTAEKWLYKTVVRRYCRELGKKLAGFNDNDVEEAERIANHIIRWINKWHSEC